MSMRMPKIQTMSVPPSAGVDASAIAMNAIRATPVTPYVSNPSAVGPTESPALSPVQSAMTPGLRGSSSGMLNMIFIRSAPMSAILVKIPPQMRSADAPSDSPIANPMKHGPASPDGMNARMQIMKKSSIATRSRPTLIPDRSGMKRVASGIRSEEHTSELQSLRHLVCRLLLGKKEHTYETASLRQLE